MTESDTPLTPEQIHELLFAAFVEISTIRGRADRVSPDTALAIGYALGTIGKAKALVGRDIDQARKSPA